MQIALLNCGAQLQRICCAPSRLSIRSARNVLTDGLLLLIFREQHSRVLSRNGVHGMSNELTTPFPAAPTLRAAQVYSMAALCLAVGLGIGYLMRGSQIAALPPQSADHAAA